MHYKATIAISIVQELQSISYNAHQVLWEIVPICAYMHARPLNLISYPSRDLSITAICNPRLRQPATNTMRSWHAAIRRCSQKSLSISCHITFEFVLHSCYPSLLSSSPSVQPWLPSHPKPRSTHPSSANINWPLEWRELPHSVVPAGCFAILPTSVNGEIACIDDEHISFHICLISWRVLSCRNFTNKYSQVAEDWPSWCLRNLPPTS